MLPAVLTTLLEYVGDVLVNDCGRPAPDRLLRYHGLAPLPADCCTANGTLAADWELTQPTARFPIPAIRPGTAGTPCPGYPMAVIVLRYVVCWPVPAASTSGALEFLDAEWDATSAMLAGVAECVTRELIRLVCGEAASPMAKPLLDLVPNQALALYQCTPIAPHGGCAGCLWRLYVGLKGQGVPS